MRKALYRKYRSVNFGEVVGQHHIVMTLQNAIKSGQVSHAYLFTGPRGVGKTTVARILAHEINGISYDHAKTHLDIIEIDAASNRRIDEVRDLRDKVYILPSELKYKVYIIDEVHMLTKEAFNALLKTLEEPPRHCVFIMATTELSKVPETIISRTQKFTFQPISKVDMSAHLSKMAKSEKLKINQEALELIVAHSDGSLRDGISFLDQLSSNETITPGVVSDLLGLPPASEIGKLLNSVVQSDQAGAYHKLKDLLAAGHDPVKIADELVRDIKEEFKKGVTEIKLLSFSRQLLDVSSSIHPAELLELVILEASLGRRVVATEYQEAENIQQNTILGTKAKPNETKVDKKPKSESLTIEHWPEVLTTIKSQAPSLYTALRLAEVDFKPGKLILNFQFPLHKKKVETAPNILLIKNSLEVITKQETEVVCSLTNKTVPLKTEVPMSATPAEASSLDTKPLDTITNIFGGGELLES